MDKTLRNIQCIKECRQLALDLSGDDRPLGSLLAKMADLMQTVAKDGFDSKSLSSALESIHRERDHAMEKDENIDDPLRSLLYRMSEALSASIENMMEKKKESAMRESMDDEGANRENVPDLSMKEAPKDIVGVKTFGPSSISLDFLKTLSDLKNMEPQRLTITCGNGLNSGNTGIFKQEHPESIKGTNSGNGTVPALSIEDAPKDADGVGMSLERPNLSYPDLVFFVIAKSPTGKLSVNDIYRSICDHFPVFESAQFKWKNNVRKALSSSNMFRRVKINSTRCFLWEISPEAQADRVLRWRVFSNAGDVEYFEKEMPVHQSNRQHASTNSVQSPPTSSAANEHS